MKKTKTKKGVAHFCLREGNEWRRAVLFLSLSLFNSSSRRHLFFLSTTPPLILKRVENGANTHSREAKKVESPAPMFASRAPSSSLGAHFFRGDAQKGRERERGRRNRAMSTTNLLTESGFFFFARVFGGFFCLCARATASWRRARNVFPRRDSRFVCGLEISDECDFFFYSERVGEWPARRAFETFGT